jgi:hypothetical protein
MPGDQRRWAGCRRDDATSGGGGNDHQRQPQRLPRCQESRPRKRSSYGGTEDLRGYYYNTQNLGPQGVFPEDHKGDQRSTWLSKLENAEEFRQAMLNLRLEGIARGRPSATRTKLTSAPIPVQEMGTRDPKARQAGGAAEEEQ